MANELKQHSHVLSETRTAYPCAAFPYPTSSLYSTGPVCATAVMVPSAAAVMVLPSGLTPPIAPAVATGRSRLRVPSPSTWMPLPPPLTMPSASCVAFFRPMAVFSVP